MKTKGMSLAARESALNHIGINRDFIESQRRFMIEQALENAIDLIYETKL